MNNNTKGWWDLMVKLFGIVAVVGSGLWGMYSYRENSEKEFRRPVWERQLGLYFEITAAAAKIASLPEGDKKTEALQTYWTLYHGPLVIVQDLKTVADANLHFARCLVKPGDTKPDDHCDQSDLRLRAVALALACKRSIAESWDRKLEALKGAAGQ